MVTPSRAPPVPRKGTDHFAREQRRGGEVGGPKQAELEIPFRGSISRRRTRTKPGVQSSGRHQPSSALSKEWAF